MKNPFHTPFVTVFQNEVVLNSKRVAPYVLMILFVANAVLWWNRGPAVALGWATNSDFYIARGLVAFSFLLGLPIFNAVIMGDPVIRDFRAGIDPLIFSKPVSRAQYLLGKFLGNFFVLVCCQAVFPITQMVLQAFPTAQMVVQPFKVFPYFKHFFFFLVITHLALAAFYFTVGTLTRNSKIVYGLAVCFYPLYISSMVFLLRGLPVRARSFLDPFQLNFGPSRNGFGHSAEFLNQYVVQYNTDKIANRALMLLAAGVCLVILYVRFTISERSQNAEKLSVLSLSTPSEAVYYDADSFQETHTRQFDKPDSRDNEMHRVIPLPDVARANEGMRANFNKLTAALGVEFRLLLSERSLIVIMPLAIVISTLEVAFWSVAPEPSFSAAYAGNTAKALLLFLLGITIFYTVEAMHRDRDLKIEPLLWSQAGPNYALLLSKLLATLALTFALIVIVGVIAIALQVWKRNSPIELAAYLRIYGLILIPNTIFMAAAALALNVLLRNRYVTYAAVIGTCAVLFFLYSQGHNHWLYNPLLFQLWSYADLVGGLNRFWIFEHRLYVLALSAIFIALAHLAYPRRSSGGADVTSDV